MVETRRTTTGDFPDQSRRQPRADERSPTAQIVPQIDAPPASGDVTPGQPDVAGQTGRPPIPTNIDGTTRRRTSARSPVRSDTMHTGDRRPMRIRHMRARDYRRALSARLRLISGRERVETRLDRQETRMHSVQGHARQTVEHLMERGPVLVGESSRDPRQPRGVSIVDPSTEDIIVGDPAIEILEARFLHQGPPSLPRPHLDGLFLEILGRRFDGTENPTTAGCWLISAHRTLFGLDCPESIWTSVAVSAFEGLARQWWELRALASFAALSLEATITWDMFCKIFRQRFLDAEEYRFWGMEFHYLRQGYASVLTYASLFDALLQFAPPELVSSETDIVTHFIEGLHGRIGAVMRGSYTLTLADAVTWACRMEQDLGIHPWLRPPQRLWRPPRR